MNRPLQYKGLAPLILEIDGTEHQFRPVAMNAPLPSTKPERWRRILIRQGQRIALPPDQLEVVSAFLKKNATDALQDAVGACYTLATDGLLECDPSRGYDLVVFDRQDKDCPSFVDDIVVQLGQTSVEFRSHTKISVALPHKIPRLTSYRAPKAQELSIFLEELRNRCPDEFGKLDSLQASQVRTLIYWTGETGFMIVHGGGRRLTFTCGYHFFDVNEGELAALI